MSVAIHALMVLLIVVQLLLQPIMNQLDPDATIEDTQRQFTALVNDPQYAGRIVAAGGSLCLCFACWVAGATVSLIAFTRRSAPGRRLAAAGLVCAAVPPVMFCLTSVLGLAVG